MLDLEYELKGMCRHNRDGAYITQAQREDRLLQMARDLNGLGYRNMGSRSLKPKHVEALVDKWQGASLSAGTIKNRMSDLRWWAEKIGKPQIVAKSNDHYGVQRRVYVTNESKARTLDATKVAGISDPHVALSVRLQAAFGLRREEAMKLRPAVAIAGDLLILRPSWCKGGRGRDVPIRTAEQRELLEEARDLAGDGSLIPADRRYVDQRRRYERECVRAGLDRNHGLRHTYAQNRYRDLTGWAPPAAGGPRATQLSREQRQQDREARLQVSRELGHEREQITAVYLGR
jgi:integrase